MDVRIKMLTFSHAPSGRTYNLNFNPPKIPGVDDITNEPLSKREDDNVEVFLKRLETYEKQTKPLVDYYQDKNLLVEYKGKSSDEISPLIHRDLDKFLR